jgi:hypothetical protein
LEQLRPVYGSGQLGFLEFAVPLAAASPIFRSRAARRKNFFERCPVLPANTPLIRISAKSLAMGAATESPD